MRTVLSVFLLSAIVNLSCSSKPAAYEKLNGFAQGTTYSIIYLAKQGVKITSVAEDIEKIFRDIDMSLSLYNDSSLLSRINRNETAETDECFRDVFQRSFEISEMTDGAFDITVLPLVKAWGFGPDEQRNFDTSRLDSLLNLVGYRKVKIENDRIVKEIPGISLDVNAIAQGYTVDVVSNYLTNKGIKSFLVEIGGEVRVSGLKYSVPWKIGIDRPTDGNMIPGDELQAIINMSDRALATSGNYRKFYIEEGVKYSHTINPGTGYPARNTLLSATVLASDCATADAIATACMVMGLEKAKEFLGKHKEFQGYFVYSDEKGNYESWISEELLKNISEE